MRSPHYGSARAREYGGMINADLYQAVVIVQEWRDAGHQVKAATFNPLANSRRASPAALPDPRTAD